MWLMLFFLEYFSLSDEYHQTMNFLQTLSLIASHPTRVVTSFLPGLPFQVDPTTKSGYLNLVLVRALMKISWLILHANI